MPVERKKRQDGGLRRIFERSLQDLKTDVHNELDSSANLDSSPPKNQSSPQQSNSTNQAANTSSGPSQEKCTTPDKDKLIQTSLEDLNPSPQTLKDKGACFDLGEDLKVVDGLKESVVENAVDPQKLVDCKNKIEFKNDLTKRTEKENVNIKARSDKLLGKTVPQKCEKKENDKNEDRERRSSPKSNQQELKSRLSQETSGREAVNSRRHFSSKETGSKSKRKESERRSASNRDKDRRKEKRRSRDNKKRLERFSEEKEDLKSTKVVEVPGLSDPKGGNFKGRNERKGFGTPASIGEDWMPELLNIPLLDSTKIILEQETLPGGHQNNELSKGDQIQIGKTESNEDLHKTVSISVKTTNRKLEENEALNDLTGTYRNDSDSANHVEELWECQDIAVHFREIYPDKIKKIDVKISDISLDTIDEESQSSLKELCEDKNSQVSHIHEMKRSLCDNGGMEKVENELMNNQNDDFAVNCGELSGTQSEERVPPNHCIENKNEIDSVSVDECVVNHGAKNTSYLDYSKKKSQDKWDEKLIEDNFVEESILAAGDCVSVRAKPNSSDLLEDWGSDDTMAQSDAYHLLLKDKIVALESRMSTIQSFGPRGQMRGSRSRGKHRRSNSPFQSYLKTIHFGDGTKVEQSDSPEKRDIISADFTENDLNDNCTISLRGEEQEETFCMDSSVPKNEEHPPQQESQISLNTFSTGNWPRHPPGFFTNPPSCSIVSSLMSSSQPWFGERVPNDSKVESSSEKVNEKNADYSLEKYQYSLCDDNGKGSLTNQTKLALDEDKAGEEITGEENWEDSLYDEKELELLMAKSKIMDSSAVVPSNWVSDACDGVHDDSGLEQCVPEDKEAPTSSMESLSIQLPSSSWCNSQNTLSEIPTISEYENSVKGEESDLQCEDSLEDGIQKDNYHVPAVLDENDEKSIRRDQSKRQKLDDALEEMDKRNVASASRGSSRNGLRCQCPSECVQFWMWRSCLCQMPYLYMIQSEADGSPTRDLISNQQYVYPADQNNNAPSDDNLKGDISDDVLKKWKLTGFLKKSPARKSQRMVFKENCSGIKDFAKESPDIGSTDHEKDIKASQYRVCGPPGDSSWDLDRKQDISIDNEQQESSYDIDDSEALELADGDSGDEFLIEAVNSQTSEEADNILDPNMRQGANRNLHNQQQHPDMYPTAQSMDCLNYPPNYVPYSQHQTAGYPGAAVSLGRGYPGLYPDPYYPYPPLYMNGGYSRQPFVDGQMYPEHLGYYSPMYYPYYMMVSGWREMTMQYRESQSGSFPRFQHPSTRCVYESQDHPAGRSRKESEKSNRDAVHGDMEDQDWHHQNTHDRHPCSTKTMEDTNDSTTAVFAEESAKKNNGKYLPPHKRIQCAYDNSVEGESRTGSRFNNLHSQVYRKSHSHLHHYAVENQGSGNVDKCGPMDNLKSASSEQWQHHSSSQNPSGDQSSVLQGLHPSRETVPRSPQKTAQATRVLEREPSGCNLLIAPSSTESTPTSSLPRCGRFYQQQDREFDPVPVDWKTAFQERCRDYGVDYIDSHCHIDFLFNRIDFRGKWSDFQAQNAETFPPSYHGCVAVFCNPNSFKSEGLWKSLSKENNVWLAFGCHPKNARDFGRWCEEGLRRCLRNERVVALGEIGLDYSGMFIETKELQKTVFKKQIGMALDMKKPLVIHCRDAEQDCLDILKQMVPRDYKIHCHCFTGDFKSAKLWLDHFPNLYIGLTPLVTYRTATGARDVAKFISLRRLLLESDAPYFVPKTIPKEAMNFSHPGLCVTVAEEVARLKNIPVRTVLEACIENTKDMYGI
uniref:Uncharacterized protein n=1 Tax=Magallana gigas TaxID=29159 RepID=A0A8W8IU07_MAGGI|nr:uncharacterized protein LOC105345191 isoform X2 [Crassostrea gigas]